MKPLNEGYLRFMALALIVLIAIIILSATLTGSGGLAARLSTGVSRQGKNIPVVEDYYAKNWDYRARNGNDQVIVIAHAGEVFEKLLFRISCAVALCAHMGFAPPLVVTQSSRSTDCPAIAREVPELIQDIFPRLRVLNVASPDSFAKTAFPGSMHVRGEITRAGRFEFLEFPKITSPTIVLEGDWESWKYTEDYRVSVFESLEFHPAIYHYARKTYPLLFDRKSPVSGIVLGNGVRENWEGEIRGFLKSRTPGERLLVFGSGQVPDPSMFGENATIVSGETSQVIIYVAAFFKVVLIDPSLTGWWAGMHAYYRGKNVSYITDDESEHFLSPHWSRNKSEQ
jgi:hypothetical protein